MINILLWLLAVEILGLVVFPIAFTIFKRLPDRGATVSKVFGLLVTTYLLWILGLTGLVPNSRLAILGILLALAIVSILLLRRHFEDIRAFIRRERFHLLAGEALFLVFFFTWLAIIAQAPNIAGTEQPMDLGLLNGVLRSPGFPAEDVWLSGNSINYYHFGHIAMSGLTKLTGIASSITYNLSLALLPALVSLASYGLVYNLARLAGGGRARSALFGLAAPALIGLVSNLVGVLNFIQARGWGSDGFWQWVSIDGLARSTAEGPSLFPQDSNWWWRASRVINTFEDGKSLDFTITEFPFFSLLVRDLHAHVLALPFLLLTLALFLNLLFSKDPPGLGWLRRNPVESLVLALSIGALAFVNLWDLPSFSVLLIGLFFLLGLKRYGPRLGRVLLQSLAVAVPILVGAFLLFLPFYVDLEGQSPLILPLRHVSTRPFFFILVWGLFLTITVSLLARQLWSAPKPRRRGDAILALTAVLTLAPIVLWAALVFFPLLIDQGPSATAAAILSRFAKLLPLLAVVGISVYSVLARAREGPSSLVFCLALIALSFYLLMGIELFHVVDLHGLRMNTVFKLYYQVWLLLAVASAFGLYYWFSRPRPTSTALRWGNHAWIAFVVLLVAASLYYPAGAALGRVQHSASPATLDGLAFLQNSNPAEHDAILVLRDRAPRGRIVEAVGDDYTDHGRIASATGLPSPLNWWGHQLHWRGSREPFEGREQDVAAIYQSDDVDEIRGLLDKYGIRYLYLGHRERAKYGPLDETKFSRLMQVYFRSGDVTVYERVPSP